MSIDAMLAFRAMTRLAERVILGYVEAPTKRSRYMCELQWIVDRWNGRK